MNCTCIESIPCTMIPRFSELTELRKLPWHQKLFDTNNFHKMKMAFYKKCVNSAILIVIKSIIITKKPKLNLFCLFYRFERRQSG